MINQSLLLAGDDAYNLTKSLRFRSSASAYLSRTPASAGNRKTWTWSAWVKRGTQTEQMMFGCGVSGSDDSTYTYISFGGTNADQLYVNGYTQTWRKTTQLFRDFSAWYHIVVAVDTTQATADNRIKMYVNGLQITSFATSNNPSQNTDLSVNRNAAHSISSRNPYGADSYVDGYMAEVNFIDGQQLSPSSFGETDSITGVWKPKKFVGTYGTNGFYLPFTPASTSYAASFNGSNQTLQIPNHSSFNIGTNDYCMEGWFYFNSLGSVQNLWGSDNGSGSTPKFLALANTNGSLTLEFTNSGGVSFLVSSSGAVTTGKWHHIAYVRSSGTSSIYVDGVSVGSTSTSVNLSGLTQPFYIGWIGENYGSLFNGLISNFRYVTGSPVYTSNFTPPTAALTAISGTQYLTLQNATIIDNSPNAFTITNNNGVSVSSANPFLYSVTTDYSGNGNNWTPNNISLTAGTTYDSMVDVPTMSALGSNYAVLNPLWKDSGVTIKDGNLDVSGGNYGGISTFIAPTGYKFYAEYTVTATEGNQYIGITKANANGQSLANFDINNSNGCGYYSANGNKSVFGVTNTAYGSSWGTVGDVIGVALDLVNNTVTFYKNNTSQGAISITASTDYFFTVSNATSTGGVAANFGQRPFSYTPPTGFVALNTFNLPEPSIKAGNKHFDAKLYTGNGGTQSITGFNFSPDFIWAKSRSNAVNHNLYDNVRGTNKLLSSSLTDAEYTGTTGLTSFNSDGYTTGSDSWLNASGQTYVAWGWDANGTGSSNTAGSITSTVSANPTAGFSVVTYTGNGTSGATVGHGLGVAPRMVILKRRDGTEAWPVYHASLPSAAYYLRLNGTDAQDTATSFMNNTAPSSSVFTLGNGGFSNTNTWTYVAYCFAEVAGYSKFGSYVGNASTDGAFVHLGFKPKFIMTKAISTGSIWGMWDASRNTYNAAGNVLQAQASDAEISPYNIDILSNGFKMRDTNSNWNGSGQTFIYMAFAETPFRYSNAR